MVDRPPAGTIPDAPGLVPVQGRARAGSSTSARPRACASGCRTTSRTRATCTPRTAQMVATAETRRVDPGAQRGRGADARVQPHQAAPAPVQHPAARRQELPVPRRHRSTTSGRGRMVMRGPQAQGRRATSGPYAHAYAIRETLDLLLRTFPIRTCSRQQVRPAPAPRPAVPAVPHREVLRAVRRRDRPRGLRRSSSQELFDFLDGDTDADRQAARRARCARRPTSSSSSGRPGCATGSPAVRKAIERQQMVADTQRGLRRDRHRRRRARGGGAGVLRAQGPGRRAQGLRRRQGRGPRRPASSSPGSSRSSTATSRRSACPSRCSCRSSPTTSTLYEEWLTDLRGSRVADPRAAAGRQARAARDGHPQREGGVHPPPAAPRRRPQQPGPGAQRAAGRSSACPRRRCASSATTWRHLQGTDYVGSMVVMEDGLPRSATTAGSRSRTSPGNDDFAAMEEVLTRRLTAYLAERDQPDRASGRAVRLPAAAAAGRRRQGPARRGRAGACEELGLEDEIPVAVAGQAVRGGLRPGPSRAGRRSRGSPRRCTCCSGSATRPTASPSPSTASCAASG